jgi:hypothetical protein
MTCANRTHRACAEIVYQVEVKWHKCRKTTWEPIAHLKRNDRQLRLYADNQVNGMVCVVCSFPHFRDMCA